MLIKKNPMHHEIKFVHKLLKCNFHAGNQCLFSSSILPPLLSFPDAEMMLNNCSLKKKKTLGK